MPSIGSDMLAPLLRHALGYGEALLKDIKPADFSRKPEGIDTNHPAFIYGHLAIYPERVLEFVGKPDLAKPDPRFVDLFAAGKPCVDDPLGVNHPSMDEILTRYRSRYEVLGPVLAATPDSVYLAPNPNERMRERFPSCGAMCVFMVSGHMMMHFGQLSAWRRCMGLPSAL